MDQKKAKELLYVRLFKEEFAEFPPGEIVPDETPDFFVRSHNRCVGIEVTRIFREVVDERGQSLQHRESELQQIVQAARAIHESSGRPSVIVRAYFSRHHVFRERDRQHTANSLAEIVGHNMPNGFGDCEMEYDPAKTYFSDRINTVQVGRQPWLSHNEWAAPEAAWAREHRPKFLQSELDKKAGKYQACRRKCEEVWLLVLSGTERLASIVHFKPEALQHGYTTPFDRVFLFENGKSVTPLRKV